MAAACPPPNPPHAPPSNIEFDSYQKKALEAILATTDEPSSFIIEAVAGSGKTTVVREAVRQLCEKKLKTHPDKKVLYFLYSTFTIRF